MQNSEIESYLEQFLPQADNHVRQIEAYASEHHVPIMEKTAISVMLHFLKIHQPEKILEIGTAIGYSAIRMAKSLPHTKIVTIERDRKRYDKAVHNITSCHLDNRITTLFGDALDLEKHIQQLGPFDVLFIDAAKSQYQRFFELYEPMLTERAVIISDNVLFKGLVAQEVPPATKRLQSLVKKIKQYNEWLMNHPQYDTTIIPVGDGVAISIKRGEKG